MNLKFLAGFVLIAAVAAPAFAAESANHGNLPPKANALSPAVARGEMQSVHVASESGNNEANYFVTASTSTQPVNRAEVRAEVRRARAAGELDFTEVNYPVLPAAPASTLTRAQVRAETIRAIAAGELQFTEAGVILIKP